MSSSMSALSSIDLSGNPYDVGVALGRFGAESVRSRLVPSRFWSEIVVPARKSARISAMKALVLDAFPAIYDEILGISDAVSLPFDDVFAWNCRGDLSARTPDGCTTVQLPGPVNLVAHNEDGLPGFDGHCALATVRPDHGPWFTAFVYPGSIAGHTFAVTGAGLVVTVNNIRSVSREPGIPRMVLTRALLSCGSIDAAVALLRGAPRAGAFHVTLAQSGDSRIVSVEFDAEDVSALEIEVASVHANHLVHDEMGTHAQHVTASSASRQKRGAALVAAAHGEADRVARTVLFDDAGDLPIHRREPHDPDDENTLATALFAVSADRVDWTVYDGRRGMPAHAGTVIPAAGAAQGQ